MPEQTHAKEQKPNRSGAQRASAASPQASIMDNGLQQGMLQRTFADPNTLPRPAVQPQQPPSEISKSTVQRSQQVPMHLTSNDVYALQRSAGNQAVLKLLGRSQAPPHVQRSLTVGPAKDRYEEEADRVAGQVAQRAVAVPAPPPAVGAEGGPVDSDTSQEIRRARGGGQPIADNVRAPIESALGTNLSHTRVHTGERSDQLNEKLGARAFTVGSDIFMKRNEYKPGSSSGNKLLYHEMTHVQQQTGGLQRSPKDTIQRSWIIVRSPAWSRVPTGPLTNLDPDEKVKAVSKGTKERKYPKMFRTQIQDDDSHHIKDKSGNTVWYRLQSGKNEAYLPAAKVLAGIAPSGNENSNPDSGEEGLEDALDGMGSWMGNIDNDLVEAQQGYVKKEAANQDQARAQGMSEEEVAEVGLSDSDETQSTMVNKAEVSMWMGSSAIGTVTGIMGMASSLKTLRNDESSTWDKVDAVFEYFASGASTIGSLYGLAGSASTVANMHAEEGSSMADASEAAAGWGFGYQAMFGVLSSGIQTVKAVADLVHMVYEEATGKGVHDRDTYLNTVSTLLTNALDAVRGVLVSIRTITQLVQGGIMDVFDNIIPGLDIAIAAVNMIFEGYYLIESAVHHWWMKSRKKKLLEKSGNNKDTIKEAQEFYSKREAQKANASSLSDKNSKKINKLDAKALKTSDFDKKVSLSEKKNKLRNENTLMDTKKTTAEQEMVDYEGNNHPSRKDIAEIDLVSELKDVNKKRIVRQSIHIASNLMKIAGSITALVAGPGAPAGIALKAAAVGVDISLPIARSLKQWGRNKAAENQAKDKNGKGAKVVNKIFNADKSTVAKLTNRKKQAVKILLIVADLNRHIPIRNDPVKRKELAKDIQIAERYIRAAGVSPGRLYHANGNPSEQIKILVEALCKRELG